jgi:hypothetical protein
MRDGDWRRFWRGTLTGGLAAGILDTLLAMGQFGIGPIIVYQSVASGLLGRAAYSGGLATAALGMLLHFFIATTAAAVYFAASSRLKLLVERVVPCGLAFGVAVYFFMKQIVVPLSAARPIPFTWTGLVGHALLVGLPIALVARRSLGNPSHGARPHGGGARRV